MPKSFAHYDTYDYPSYWKGRDYEHLSEVIALNAFLSNIERFDTLMDVGGGYGRLIPHYAKKTDKIILAEPSIHLLDIAREHYKKNKKISFLHSPIEGLMDSLKPNSLDAILMVRVMHHLSDPSAVIQTFSKLLKKDGILVLEFANKIHGKAQFANLCRGDFNFSKNMTPTDRRCVENKKDKIISFYNYHPQTIMDALSHAKLKILSTRSVSNVRNPSAKKYIPLSILMKIEGSLQKPLSSIYFGPSIFVLAQK